jgi:hypothetical protein
MQLAMEDEDEIDVLIPPNQPWLLGPRYQSVIRLEPNHFRFLFTQCRTIGRDILAQSTPAIIFTRMQQLIDRALMVAQELETNADRIMLETMRLLVAVLDELQEVLPWSRQHMGDLFENLLARRDLGFDRIVSVLEASNVLFKRYSSVVEEQYDGDYFEGRGGAFRTLMQMVLDFPSTTVKCFLDSLQRDIKDVGNELEPISPVTSLQVVFMLISPLRDFKVLGSGPTQLQIENLGVLLSHSWVQQCSFDEDTYTELQSVLKLLLPRHSPILRLLHEHGFISVDDGSMVGKTVVVNEVQACILQQHPILTPNKVPSEQAAAEHLRKQQLEREAERAQVKRAQRIAAERRAAKQARRRGKFQGSSALLHQDERASNPDVDTNTSTPVVVDDDLPNKPAELLEIMAAHPEWSRSKARAALFALSVKRKQEDHHRFLAIEAARKLDPEASIARNARPYQSAPQDDMAVASSVSASSAVHPAAVFERQRRKQLKKKRAAVSLVEFRTSTGKASQQQ